jgi:hypothetical protein
VGIFNAGAIASMEALAALEELLELDELLELGALLELLKLEELLELLELEELPALGVLSSESNSLTSATAWANSHGTVTNSASDLITQDRGGVADT